ncbi:MAG: isopeptide-forming domain-containing fimbrial protein [Trueperaceae bacterium]
MLAALLQLAWAAGTPAGTVIVNQARFEYLREGTPAEGVSNKVKTVVNAVCSVSVLPNGTRSAPAYVVDATPGGTTYLAYALTNTGNHAHAFAVEAVQVGGAPLGEGSLALIWDQDLDQIAGGDEPLVTTVVVPAEGTVQLLLAVAISRSAPAGDVAVNLVARCGGYEAADDDNVSVVRVPPVDAVVPVKTAVPAAGLPLYPGAPVRYTIGFTAERDLSAVVVRDTLSAALAAPTSFSDGLVTDAGSGLSADVVGAYDAGSHTVTWTLPAVPAGMAVALELITAVRADAAPGATIDNLAGVRHDGGPETPSNVVHHPLAPFIVVLQKDVAPRRARVGDELTYTITITNPPGNPDYGAVTLTDALPAEVSYRPGSSLVTLPDGTIYGAEPVADGRSLSWQLPGVASGDRLRVTFVVTVGASALASGSIVNVAAVEVRDTSLTASATATAAASATVDAGVFEGRSVLLGTAYVDLDQDGRFDQERDVPVEGLRVYLSDGTSTVTDAAGRYAFTSLRAGLVALRVDATTAPPRLFGDTRSQDQPGLWRVRLQPGVITRRDVPFSPHRMELAVSQVLTVERGPVTLTKAVFSDGQQPVVRLVVRVNEPLAGLHVADVIPAGANARPLTFDIGDVEPGHEAVFYYAVHYDGPPAELLLAPEIGWRVR